MFVHIYVYVCLYIKSVIKMSKMIQHKDHKTIANDWRELRAELAIKFQKSLTNVKLLKKKII